MFHREGVVVARRSVITDLMELSSRLPWLLALGLALGSYFGLHWLALRFATPVAPQGLSDLATVYTHTLIAALTSVFQYIVPLALVAGAIMSLVQRRRGAILFTRAISGGAAALHAFTWSEFEHVVGEGFRKDGYTVRSNVGGGPDGGVDLVLQKGAKQCLVQCKHWRTSSVGVAVIREFFGVMTAHRVDGGFVVTSGSFTAEARNFAAQCEIGLIDGSQLERWISRYRDSQADSRERSLKAPVTPVATPRESPPPACPKCSVAMVLRTARRGPSAGQPFWGCSRFPQCRETRPA